MSEDVTIVCPDCENEFTWTSGEQEYYQTRGFSAPKRCKACRDSRKKKIVSKDDKEIVQTRHQANCDDCNAVTTVPFKPVAGKPVYCKKCFDSRKKKKSSMSRMILKSWCFLLLVRIYRTLPSRLLPS